MRTTSTTESIRTSLDTLYHDPCTPAWAKRIIEECAQRDPVKVAAVLETLARAAGQDADATLYMDGGF